MRSVIFETLFSSSQEFNRQEGLFYMQKVRGWEREGSVLPRCAGYRSSGRRNFLAMVDAVGGNAKGQRAHGGNCGFTTRPVGHHSGHGLDVGPPAAVVFPPHDDGN